MSIRLSILGKLFISHFIAILLVSGTVGSYFYLSAIDNLMRSLQSRLQNSAALIGQGIEVRTLDDIREAADMATPRYQGYVARLRTFVRANPDIAFIYVMRRQGDDVVFVLDSDSDRPAVPGETYPHRIAALMEGFVRPSVDAEITGDKWGYFLSGYAPLEAGRGEYLIGVDMRADDVHAQFAQIRMAGMLSLLFSVLLAAASSALLASGFKRRIQSLALRFNSLEVMDDSRLPKARGDELDQLASNFDVMAGQLQAKQRALRQAREDLEQRVEMRTAELLSANRQLRDEIGERRRMERMYELASRTDYLTGALNRRAMTQHMQQLAGQLSSDDAGFCLVLLDLDRFKDINDRYGHHVGDQVLTSVVVQIRAGLRESDELGRWGGEEFLVVLLYTDLHQGALLAERLCQALAATQLGGVPPALQVTGSFGVAHYSHGDDLDACLRRADRALYDAKARGRNRVVAMAE